MYKSYLKRIFDFVLGLILLLLFSPVIVLLFLLLLLPTHFQPLFTQKRPGLDGEIMKLKKFRTMNNNKNSDDQLLSDDKRMFPLGRFIRAWSLDELPQLVHVIFGQMSLVGPRPLLEEYLPLYDKFQLRRHRVKPGITGWAQVNGRNELTWQQKFELDVWYVDNVSFKLDLKILILTLLKVIKREGVSSKSSVTMEKFKGN